MPAAHPVPGDPSDPDGFAVLVESFCEWMAIRGYSPKTIDRYHVSLALFADWAVARGVDQPRETGSTGGTSGPPPCSTPSTATSPTPEPSPQSEAANWFP